MPTVQLSADSEYSATWIGIDGLENSDLIQTGTDQFASGGSTTYAAWYDISPGRRSSSPSRSIPVTTWMRLSLRSPREPGRSRSRDVTQGWLASGPFSYSGPADSAEWIEEAPTDNGVQSTLANFDVDVFGSLMIGGADLSSSDISPVNMVNTADTIIAYPPLFDANTDSLAVFYGSPTPPVVTSISPSHGPSGGTKRRDDRWHGIPKRHIPHRSRLRSSASIVRSELIGQHHSHIASRISRYRRCTVRYPGKRARYLPWTGSPMSPHGRRTTSYSD